jgi:hypothetical protein
MNHTSPIIVTGPPGSGKSHWIHEYTRQQRKQLITCSCRKDRTLREGRQKLHVLGRRREAVILWLEGADDLTPEAQAFLRRILETHSSDVQFVLECREPSKLQEPIRSRCVVQRILTPTADDLRAFAERSYKGVDIDALLEYLLPDEYSYRKVKQCLFLQTQEPALWEHLVQKRNEERRLVKEGPRSDLVPTYQSKALHPDMFLKWMLTHHPERLAAYGECLELSGSAWAFLASSLDE